MRRSRIDYWIVHLSVLLLAFAPPVSAGWQCEGRPCGVTPWHCCCDSPGEAREASCAALTDTASGTAACLASCGCLLTIRAVDSMWPVASGLPLPVFDLALLPQSPARLTPQSREVMARVIETRGPLLPRVAPGPVSSRAPPTS